VAAAIECFDLTKTYSRHVTALHDITLQIAKGSSFGPDRPLPQYRQHTTGAHSSLLQYWRDRGTRRLQFHNAIAHALLYHRAMLILF
jgi:hypothetical protein